MDSNERKRNLMLVGVLALVVFLCVGSFSATAAFGYFFFRDGGNSRSLEIRIEQPAAASTPGKETPTPARPRETPKATKKAAAASQPTGAAVLPPIQESESEAQLAGVIVPTRDLRDLALRLRPDVDSIPQEVAMTEYKIGDEIEFWASNVDDKRQFKVKATLIYTTDVAYVWVESGKEHDKDKIIRSVDTFSEKSYPVEREFFGSEWKPGIDKDPRLHILHANDLGSSIAGYYSSADEFSNLLTGVLGHASLAAAEMDSHTSRDIIAIEQTAREAAQLVRKLAALSGSGKHVQDNDLAKMLKQYVKKMPPEFYGGSPQLVLCDDACLVHGDTGSLKMVLEAISAHARDKASEDAQVCYTLSRADEDVCLSLSYNGSAGYPTGWLEGLPPSIGQSGWDLVFAREVVRGMGGEIELTDDGERTMLLMTMPVVNQEEQVRNRS